MRVRDCIVVLLGTAIICWVAHLTGAFTEGYRRADRAKMENDDFASYAKTLARQESINSRRSTITVQWRDNHPFLQDSVRGGIYKIRQRNLNFLVEQVREAHPELEILDWESPLEKSFDALRSVDPHRSKIIFYFRTK